MENRRSETGQECSGKLGSCVRRATRTTPTPEDRSLATLTALSFVSSCICTFAPAGSVWRVVVNKATLTEVVGLALPYFCLFAQGYFWALYGVVVKSMEIADVNVLCSVVCLIYLSVLASFVDQEGQEGCPKDKQFAFIRDGSTVRTFLGIGCLALAVVSALILSVRNTTLQSELLAYTALCFNIGIFLAPMRQCVQALRTGSSEGFPLALTVAGFISCGLWGQYSILTHNFAYLIPNALGLLCNSIQIGIVAWVHVFGRVQDSTVESSREAQPRSASLRVQWPAISYGTLECVQDSDLPAAEEEIPAADDEDAGPLDSALGSSETGGSGTASSALG